jgi:hypothetical protein
LLSDSDLKIRKAFRIGWEAVWTPLPTGRCIPPHPSKPNVGGSGGMQKLNELNELKADGLGFLRWLASTDKIDEWMDRKKRLSKHPVKPNVLKLRYRF